MFRQGAAISDHSWKRKKERKIYLPRTITVSNKKTILKLGRIAGCQKSKKPSMLAANIVNTLTLIHKNQ